MFRIQRLKGIIDEDKNSAHFSMKDSNLELSGRLEVVSSSRSSPPHELVLDEGGLKQAKDYQ
jgi:hypothetical protein